MWACGPARAHIQVVAAALRGLQLLLRTHQFNTGESPLLQRNVVMARNYGTCSKLVENGFVSDESWKNRILVGTKPDRATPEELVAFPAEIASEIIAHASGW